MIVKLVKIVVKNDQNLILMSELVSFYVKNCQKFGFKHQNFQKFGFDRQNWSKLLQKNHQHLILMSKFVRF